MCLYIQVYVNMFVYMYMYMYQHFCMCVCTCASVCILYYSVCIYRCRFLCMCMCTCMYTCTCSSTCMCTYTCKCVCIHAHMQLFKYSVMQYCSKVSNSEDKREGQAWRAKELMLTKHFHYHCPKQTASKTFSNPFEPFDPMYIFVKTYKCTHHSC